MREAYNMEKQMAKAKADKPQKRGVGAPSSARKHPLHDMRAAWGIAPKYKDES